MAPDPELHVALVAKYGQRRRCNACGCDHPIEDFPIKNRSKLTIHGRCKMAQRAATKANYAANQPQRKAMAAAYRSKLRETVNDLVDAWLSTRGCSVCGATDRLLAIGENGKTVRALQQFGGQSADVSRALDGASVICRSGLFK